MKHVISAFAVVLPVLVIGWVFDIFRTFGIVIYSEQFLAAALGLALALVFLTVPAGPGRKRAERAQVPIHDIVACVISLACCAYIAVRFPSLSQMVYSPPADGLVVAAVTCLLLLEGLRRTSGWGITVVTLGIVSLALLGQHLPGTLQGREVSLSQLTYFLVWDASAILGTTMNIVVVLVLAFIVFGNTLLRTGGAEFFTDLSMSLMGRFRGGPAKIAIMASMLFGTISGSVVANVMTTGTITIPMMKKGGFSPEQAGAVEAVAATGGQIMPPVMGVVAFLMAEFLQVPYTTVATAAIIPALMFYGAFFLYVDLIAARNGIRPAVSGHSRPALQVLYSGWPCLVPFAVLAVAMFHFDMQPERAALLATTIIIAVSLAFGIRGRQLKPQDLFEILRACGLAALDLFMIGAAAGVVIAALNYTGLGFGLAISLVQVAQGNVFALLLLACVASIILGMGMPTPGVYLLLATLIAPSLIELGVSPLAAHMFILYYGMLSMISPPVAIGAFAAANIAKADAMRTAWTAVQLGWSVYVVPFVFVFSDTLLMIGEPIHIFLDVCTAALGMVMVTVGLVGFALTRIPPIARIAAVAIGLALILPMRVFEHAGYVHLAGFCLAAGMAIWQVRQSRSYSFYKPSPPR
jgi:TRAP transporter 4TM/12TM fusion protein